MKSGIFESLHYMLGRVSNPAPNLRHSTIITGIIALTADTHPDSGEGNR